MSISITELKKMNIKETLEVVKKNLFTGIRVYNHELQLVNKGRIKGIEGDKIIFTDGSKYQPVVKPQDIIAFKYLDFRCRAGFLSLVCNFKR